jgi:hypothetical protein
MIQIGVWIRCRLILYVHDLLLLIFDFVILPCWLIINQMIYAYLAIDQIWFSLLPHPHPPNSDFICKSDTKWYCGTNAVILCICMLQTSCHGTILMGMTSLNQQLQSVIYYKSSEKHAICCSSFHTSQPSFIWILTLWLAVRSQVTTHNLWFCFMNNLLVSMWYHPGLSLAQWFHNPLMFRWNSHNHDLHGWKEGSHRMVVFSNQQDSYHA